MTQALPAVIQRLGLDPGFPMDRLIDMIKQRLLTRLSPDFPLLAAICGGGSSGKSTLFNTLTGTSYSPTGGRAGMNRRTLIAAHPDLLKRPQFCTELFAPFDTPPKGLSDGELLTHSGPPLFVAHGTLPIGLVLMDTPDFDTGAKGMYANRKLARQALEACDLFIYIFTNSNYNNRDNTDFITELLTSVGLRKSILVYRVYPSFSDQEVRQHAATVANNIYGTRAPTGVVGVYRADEHNDVAAGKQPMPLRAVDPAQPPLKEALAGLDRFSLRSAFLEALLDDVIQETGSVHSAGLRARQEIQTYLDAVRTVQSHCIRHALRTFPMDQVMNRFAEIWTATDPVHIRFMRQTGTDLSWPVKLISKGVRKVAGRREKTQGRKKRSLNIQMEENLLEAITRLRAHLLADELDLSMASEIGPDNRRVVDRGGLTRLSVPPAMEPELAKLRNSPWKPLIGKLLEQENLLTDLSAVTEDELRSLADSFREGMGLREKVTQTFAALLNVLPATVAVTYILHTGDPVGAAGIKVKLTSLFGLHDLYALVALPATSGLKKTDRKQLETLLAPIAQTWFDNKSEDLQQLFETRLTGTILDFGQTLMAKSETELQELSSALQTLKQDRTDLEP
jgi:hypothetical protein